MLPCEAKDIILRYKTMRLKYKSLIALGISTVIFSGCTSNGGGFLNLGVADALRKSRASIFKQKLGYTKTPVGNTGLSLPTFGAQPTAATSPVAIDSYALPQNGPSVPLETPSSPTSDCGCGEHTVLSSDQQFFMPQSPYVVEREPSSEVLQQPPTEVVTPPVAAAEPSTAPAIDELPAANPLPPAVSAPVTKPNKNNNFQEFDTEGTLEPLGQIDTSDDFQIEPPEEVASQEIAPQEIAPQELAPEEIAPEEIAEDHSEKDQSIFEQAESVKRAPVKFDLATDTSRADRAREPKKPAMLTLHARPAESHNVFNRAKPTPKSLETVQASHKPYYRQLNALRQQPTKVSEPSYRQARNTADEIDFKPLPPVVETPETGTLTPKTKMAPLKEMKINQSAPKVEIQNRNTRTANAAKNHTVNVTPRVPLLRATTVSSASILSLKNLANVIQDNQNQQRFYQAKRQTNSAEATVER